MSTPSPNETWVIERGDAVIEKRARAGEAGLSPWERLVYCLWATDYMMRNAGDLENAADMYPDLQPAARDLAQRLGLQATYEAFSLPQSDLQRVYFDRFEQICTEIRKASSRAQDA